MSRIVKDAKLIGTKNNVELWLMHLDCDTMQDLPAANAYGSSTLICIGSTAHIIADNAMLEIDSAGNWIQQQAGSSTYTRAEIDAMQADLQNQIDYAIDTGAKNYLKNSGVTTTNRGIDFTVYTDGTVLVNGTNDGTLSSIYTINTQSVLQIPNDDFIISGCPLGGSATTYRIDITRNVGATINDFGEGAPFKIGGDYNVQDYRIVIYRNATVDNLLFKPMVRKSIIKDDKFIPYAPTNLELYQMILALSSP